MVCCTGNEIETRLEELEVKVNTMSKIQVNVLNTIKRLETYCYFTPTSQVYSNYYDSYMPWNTTQSQYFYQTKPFVQQQQQPMFSTISLHQQQEHLQCQDGQSSIHLQSSHDVNPSNQMNLSLQQENSLQQQSSLHQSKQSSFQVWSSDNFIDSQRQEVPFQQQPSLQQGSTTQQLSHYQESLTPRFETSPNSCVPPAPGMRPCQLKYHRNAQPPLPSSEISKHSLRSVQAVLDENIALQNDSSAGTLCQRLAKEAVFW